MPFNAFLFDMDGLLIDSEILWHEAEVDVFGALGVPLSATEERSTKGLFVDEVVEYWFERYPWSGSSKAATVATILDRVGTLIETKGRMLPGARRAIALAHERGPVALASSTPLALIERALGHFDLRNEFVTVSSAEFESYGKPHPAVFLTSAASLGVAPTDCLVFEDSSAGVIAAKAARMHVVAVPVAGDRHLPAFAMADHVLTSLEDLSPEWLDAAPVS
jgi:sugar-phosphatase